MFSIAVYTTQILQGCDAPNAYYAKKRKRYNPWRTLREAADVLFIQQWFQTKQKIKESSDNTKQTPKAHETVGILFTLLFFRHDNRELLYIYIFLNNVEPTMSVLLKISSRV